MNVFSFENLVVIQTKHIYSVNHYIIKVLKIKCLQDAMCLVYFLTPIFELL